MKTFLSKDLPEKVDRALFERLWRRYCNVALNEAVFAKGYVDGTLENLERERAAYEEEMNSKK